MSELYLFSQDEKLISILSEDTGLLSAYYRMEVNNVPAEPFSFTIESDHDNVKHVKEENKVVFKDHEGDWRMMVIRELDDIDTLDGPETTATCEPVFLAELTDHIVVDRRFIDSTADKALNAALEGTRWIGEVEISLGLSSTNFYYLTSIEAIWKTKNTWGGEVKDVVVFDEETNEIVACKIKLIQRFGADIGQRFEIDHNTTEIGRTILSYPKTALYGRGASLQTENDGYTRYIDFEDVEWSIVNGDPVDKPLGQKWIGDPNLLTQLGYENGTKHRFGIYSNQDYDDPSELLQATWNYLQDSASQIAINYRLSVDLFNETVSLGDTAQAIDRRFARPVEIQTRIIAMEYDILDVEETMVIEMGQFLELDDDRIGELEETIDRDRGKWDHPIINNENFPNTKPSTPVNVSATGGFQTIQLHWDYDSHIYINSYEVYGSQVMDFIPDSQHLLYRGRVSGFNHEVATDQVWYYRIRAVNTQGTPGEFSAQVSASTVRVISDDILFGESIAAELRKLNTIADGAVTFEQLSQQAKELIQQDAKQYTDSEVSSTKNELLTDIANKADLTYVDGQLLSKADANSVYTITQLDNKFDNVVSVTKYQTDINGIVTNLESHETRIYQNELGLGSKVDATYVQSAISDIEIGGRNYFVIKDALEDTLLAWASGNPLPSTGALTSGFMPVELNATYYVSPVRTDQLFYYDINKVHISDYGNMSGGTTIQIPNDERIAFMRIVFRNNFLDGRTKEEVEVKVEKGNKATDWTPAPEDVQAQIDDNALVISNHTTLIEQNELAITQRATTTEVNELTGRMSIAEGSITTMSNQIDLKVDVDGIVSSLNLSQEGIRIKASLIELDGTTLISSGIIQNAHIANGAITNAKIGTLAVSAGQIQNAAITNAKIADLAVDSAKIA
ncbi:phage tail protein, partial [Halolactibacillus halophilus]